MKIRILRIGNWKYENSMVSVFEIKIFQFLNAFQYRYK